MLQSKALPHAPEQPSGRVIPANPDALLTAAEAAFLLGLSRRTLESHRLKGIGPAYVALGRRAVRYQRRDIDTFVAARRAVPPGMPTAP